MITLQSLAPLAAVLAFASGAAAQQEFLTTTIDGAQETPPVATSATGFGSFVLDPVANTLDFHIEFSGLTSAENNAHIHGPAAVGVPAGILYPLPPGSPKIGTLSISDVDEASILAGLTYVNIHSVNFPSGEIRGQILVVNAPTGTCVANATVAPCPCGNDPATGSGTGCVNSTGVGAQLQSSGFASMTSESFALTASNLANGSVVFFQGTQAQAPVFQGDGLRCAGGTLLRLKTTAATAGSAQYPVPGDPPASQQGQVNQPGGTRVYQAWYADPTGPCGLGYNVTNAVETVWVP